MSQDILTAGETVPETAFRAVEAAASERGKARKRRFEARILNCGRWPRRHDQLTVARLPLARAPAGHGGDTVAPGRKPSVHLRHRGASSAGKAHDGSGMRPGDGAVQTANLPGHLHPYGRISAVLEGGGQPCLPVR